MVDLIDHLERGTDWRRVKQRRRARRLGWRLSRTGAVTFIQRFSSALRLNVHFHCLVPDGVFAAESPVAAGGSSFLALPPPRDEEVEAINRRIARKISAPVQEH